MEEHAQVGEQLKAIRRDLMAIRQLVSERYGTSKKPAALAYAAFAHIDRLRSELDNRCFEDLGPEATPRIYYGAAPDAEAI